MSSRGSPGRLLELAADRALVGLAPGEALELERLLDRHGEADSIELELAAAEVDLALASDPAEPLPERLRAELAAAGRAWVDALSARSSAAPAGATRNELAPTSPRVAVLPLVGWAVAAAALAVAVLGWLPRRVASPSPADHARGYATLREAAGTANPSWEATELAPGAAGDVAWSQQGQSGFLHIVGLRPNDPPVEQYQLWILDAEQAHPVDGGVFDVRGGEEWIPIDPKLPIGRPTAFAVTIEKPGGVVVSDQERVVLLASL